VAPLILNMTLLTAVLLLCINVLFQRVTSLKLVRSLVMSTQVERNVNFKKLQAGYLFPEIAKRRQIYINANPDAISKIISLGIGDTTLPIPPHILNGLVVCKHIQVFPTS
jgi:hypothetical protein